jgi:hypothetical protein
MTSASNVRRFTAWAAILGCLFAYLNVALSLMVTGQDTAMVLHGATMLALPAETRDVFRWSMLADILGFYLPVLAIGGYLWRTFREEAGAFGDIAALAIVLYVMLGISGAAMQQAVLHPLARLHAGGDDTVRAATEATWTAVANAVQNGLWWCEGPLVFFWGLIVGSQLKKAGWGWFPLLLLRIVGWSFGLFFVFGFFPDLNALTELVETVVVLLFPLWMLLFGWQLLRRATFSQAPGAG